MSVPPGSHHRHHHGGARPRQHVGHRGGGGGAPAHPERHMDPGKALISSKTIIYFIFLDTYILWQNIVIHQYFYISTYQRLKGLWKWACNVKIINICDSATCLGSNIFRQRPVFQTIYIQSMISLWQMSLIKLLMWENQVLLTKAVANELLSQSPKSHYVLHCESICTRTVICHSSKCHQNALKLIPWKSTSLLKEEATQRLSKYWRLKLSRDFQTRKEHKYKSCFLLLYVQML